MAGPANQAAQKGISAIFNNSTMTGRRNVRFLFFLCVLFCCVVCCECVMLCASFLPSFSFFSFWLSIPPFFSVWLSIPPFFSVWLSFLFFLLYNSQLVILSLLTCCLPPSVNALVVFGHSS